jgi:DNA-binding MarR family transcriptional regulator/DNA-binding transcriptional regulator YhcF (GntR family)
MARGPKDQILDLIADRTKKGKIEEALADPAISWLATKLKCFEGTVKAALRTLLAEKLIELQDNYRLPKLTAKGLVQAGLTQPEPDPDAVVSEDTTEHVAELLVEFIKNKHGWHASHEEIVEAWSRLLRRPHELVLAAFRLAVRDGRLERLTRGGTVVGAKLTGQPNPDLSFIEVLKPATVMIPGPPSDHTAPPRQPTPVPAMRPQASSPALPETPASPEATAQYAERLLVLIERDPLSTMNRNGLNAAAGGFVQCSSVIAGQAIDLLIAEGRAEITHEGGRIVLKPVGREAEVADVRTSGSTKLPVDLKAFTVMVFLANCERMRSAIGPIARVVEADKEALGSGIMAHLIRASYVSRPPEGGFELTQDGYRVVFENPVEAAKVLAELRERGDLTGEPDVVPAPSPPPPPPSPTPNPSKDLVAKGFEVMAFLRAVAEEKATASQLAEALGVEKPVLGPVLHPLFEDHSVFNCGRNEQDKKLFALTSKGRRRVETRLDEARSIVQVMEERGIRFEKESQSASTPPPSDGATSQTPTRSQSPGRATDQPAKPATAGPTSEQVTKRPVSQPYNSKNKLLVFLFCSPDPRLTAQILDSTGIPKGTLGGTVLNLVERNLVNRSPFSGKTTGGHPFLHSLTAKGKDWIRENQETAQEIAGQLGLTWPDAVSSEHQATDDQTAEPALAVSDQPEPTTPVVLPVHGPERPPEVVVPEVEDSPELAPVAEFVPEPSSSNGQGDQSPPAIPADENQALALAVAEQARTIASLTEEISYLRELADVLRIQRDREMADRSAAETTRNKLRAEVELLNQTIKRLDPAPPPKTVEEAAEERRFVPARQARESKGLR